MAQLRADRTRSRGFPASAPLNAASRLRRFGLEGDCFHVAATVKDRRPLFRDPHLAQILLGALQFVRSERAYLLAFVIMPDHFHALLVPRRPYTLAQVMQTIKGYSSRRMNSVLGAKGSLWQQSYYDRIIRDEDQLGTVVGYIEENPVKAGLATRIEDYAWSSAHTGASTDIEAWLSA